MELTKRKYEKTKKIFIYGGSSLSVLLLFLLTLQAYGVSISPTADIMCWGTEDNPCISYVNISSADYRLVFKNSILYSEDEVTFDVEKLTYQDGKGKMCRDSGYKWRNYIEWEHIRDDIYLCPSRGYIYECSRLSSSGKTCYSKEGEYWLPFNLTGESLGAGETWQLKILGYKDPFETVKWGLKVGSTDLDPLWEKVGTKEMNYYFTKECVYNMPCVSSYSTSLKNVYDFQKKKWFSLEKAPSFKNTIIKINMSKDKNFPVEIIDYNYSSITGSFKTSNENLNKDLPIKIFILNSSNNEVIKFKTNMKLDSINDEQQLIIPFKFRETLKYGFNSTVVTYYANTTSGTYGHYEAETGTTALWSWIDCDAAAYTSTNLDDISDPASGFVAPTYSDAGGPDARMGHHLRMNISEAAEDIINISIITQNELTVLSGGCGSSAHDTGLYIGNVSATTWKLLDDSNPPAVDTAYWMGGSVNAANLTDFVNDTAIGNFIHILIKWDKTNAPDGSCQNPAWKEYYIQLNITSEAAAGDSTPPTINITEPQNLTYTEEISWINNTCSDDVACDRCWYSLDSGSTNSSTVAAAANFTSVSFSEGSNTAFLWCNDTSANEASDNVTFYMDYTAPSCSVVSATPSDIVSNSTGVYEVLINCTDTSGINISKYTITQTVEGGDAAGVPNYWSIRPPTNDKAEVYVDEHGHNLGNILRADGRFDGKWYDALFADNYSYAVQDNSSIRVSITNGSDWALLNFSWNVEPSVFRSSVYLSRGKIEAENKKTHQIYKDNPLLVKGWDLMYMRNDTNYSVCTFRNINYTDAPNFPLRVYYCNSSYDSSAGGELDDSPYCVHLYSLTTSDLDTTYYSSRNSSYSKSCFSIINNSLNGVRVSEIFYYGYYSQVPAGKSYNMKYVNGSSGTNVSFKNSEVAWYSTDDGNSWTQAEFTPDVWYSGIVSGDQLQVGVYVEDLAGNNYTNYSLYTDDIGLVNLPISSPDILWYYSSALGKDEDLNKTYSGNMTIRIGVSIDPNDFGTVNHSLYLTHPNGTIAYTINASFYSPSDLDLNISFDTSLVSDGIYRMNITAVADDNPNDIKSFLSPNNFTILNLPVASQINVSLGSGIYAVEFRPMYANQQDVWAVNQTNSVGLFNITNNGTIITNVSIKVNQTQTGWAMECANSTLFSPHIDLNTSFQQIITDLAVSASQQIWCRADLSNPAAQWIAKFVFNATSGS